MSEDLKNASKWIESDRNGTHWKKRLCSCKKCITISVNQSELIKMIEVYETGPKLNKTKMPKMD